MTRLAVSAAMLATMFTASAAHAEGVPDEVQSVADQAGVDPLDLLGAVNTTGLNARTYECWTDGLLCPAAPAPTSSARAECIIQRESGGDPRAVNPRSGAAGLGQFLASTWLTTPQGRAGMSRFDPAANRAAVNYMLTAKRASEFQVVTRGLC